MLLVTSCSRRLGCSLQPDYGYHHATGRAIGIHDEPWSRTSGTHVGIHLMFRIHHVGGEIRHHQIPHIRHRPDSDHREWALSVDVVCMLMT